MDHFPSAAARHLDHSDFLAQHSRWQEAAYLAGYSAECSLKTLIELSGSTGREFRHSLRDLSGDRSVPDIYLYGFGLKRKGGIRRPQSKTE